MIVIYPYEKLGHANHGWLDTRYHFSFADYHNPDRMGFGALRVINDDRIAAGAGFDTHPHRDMEIITYVRSGAITHRDSAGNEGRTAAGDVQVMSAGTGIFHSEKNAEDVEATLFQIWIRPRERNVAPRWAAARFPGKAAEGVLPLLVSGRAEDAGKGALYIHQDATIHGGVMKAGQEIAHPVATQRGGRAYIVVSAGELEIDGQRACAGDGAEVTGQQSVALKAVSDAEVLVIGLD